MEKSFSVVCNSHLKMNHSKLHHHLYHRFLWYHKYVLLSKIWMQFKSLIWVVLTFSEVWQKSFTSNCSCKINAQTKNFYSFCFSEIQMLLKFLVFNLYFRIVRNFFRKTNSNCRLLSGICRGNGNIKINANNAIEWNNNINMNWHQIKFTVNF